jgi:hypothetical protein
VEATGLGASGVWWGIAMQISGKRGSRLVEALNRLAEAASLIVPVIALILGIGMVRLLPPRLTTPLFYSPQDGEKFYQRLGIEEVSDVAILLVPEGCAAACDKLRADMSRNGVQYDEYDVESSYGKAFFQKAVEASGSNDLPKVIVGSSIVRPDAISVKRVLARNAELAQKQAQSSTER